MTRILAISDPHCGHRHGLTPPQWWSSHNAEFHETVWEWFSFVTKDYEPDIVIATGDLIDGASKKNGGVELIERSQIRQAEMACDLIKTLGGKNNILAYGTPYHVGDGAEDFEDIVASGCNGIIKDHPLLDVDGVMISVKHDCGSNGTPYHSAALGAEKLADTLWADIEGREKANIILRGHIHKHLYQGGVDADGQQWVAMTLPCLQMGTNFGARRCKWPITYGVTFIQTSRGKFSWTTETMSLKGSREIIRY